MKHLSLLVLFLGSSLLFSCLHSKAPRLNDKRTRVSTIAFGSCSKQSKPQPILDLISELNPAAFIYLGDNIYGDTRDMNVLKQKYEKLGNKPEFQRLRREVRLLATWDDHDFGENDAGRHYPFKEASKEIFLDFWGIPEDSERRQHTGIYDAIILERLQVKVQVILLDTRTFRDDLIHNTNKDKKGPYKNDYQPNPSPDSTFLGAEQWAWLEEQLKVEADLRIIASSNQFSHEYNGWESWTNVPHEQKKMLKLSKKTQANGVVFISGDVHWGELSKYENKHTYPIYDVTSSGLTQSWHNTEPNKHRIGLPVRKNNFGVIEIEPRRGIDTLLTFKIINKHNMTQVKHRIKLSDLRF